ncbi:MAG: HPr family phosphocarrier protein [Lachnospiraceae bacterium]|nr:HPr family phosphocarrier protein [Lachnospiraceae bacterium]
MVDKKRKQYYIKGKKWISCFDDRSSGTGGPVRKGKELGESKLVSRNIFLSDVDDVMEFVHQTEQCSYDIDIDVDGGVINAKSVLGMLSKGFRRMMQINIHAEGAKADELLARIARFCV